MDHQTKSPHAMQALNRAMPRSRNQLEEAVNRKELIFCLAVELYCTFRQ